MTNKSPIAWMAGNHVAANLLMLLFVLGGLIVGFHVKQEVFPEFELDFIQVEVPYPSASPEEIESGILLSIEDEVRSLDGVKKVTSRALEGVGRVTLELLSGVDAPKVLQDVKNAVDQIRSFPEDAEKPIVNLIDARKHVISILLFGDLETGILRRIAEKVREDLIQESAITLVTIEGIPKPEISIEVPEKNLRSLKLTMRQIADIVSRSAVEIPGGGVRSKGGELLLRVQEKRDFASEFEDISIVSNADGTRVPLSSIATVLDTFEESDVEAYYDEKRAVRVNVFRVGDQKPLDISSFVHRYVDDLKGWLPKEIQAVTWDDRAEIFKERIELLLRNAFLGLALVLILLALFLEPRLAFWVTMGIPISMIGSFLFFTFSEASINMVSLFAFIVTLGIVVDDAIVVGENIYQKREEGLSFVRAAIEGARGIAMPVTFAVLTNIAAFLPLFFVPGPVGKIFFQIPAIVVSVFAISLIESLFVLPSHLSVDGKTSPFWRRISAPSLACERFLKRFIFDFFAPRLRFFLARPYFTISCGIAVFIVSLGLIGGGIVKFGYIPRVDSDIVTAQIQLAFGIPVEKSRRVGEKLALAAKRVEESVGQNIVRGIYMQVGSPVEDMGPAFRPPKGGAGSHIVIVQVRLIASDRRKISGEKFASLWLKEVGQIVGAEAVAFSGIVGTGAGAPVDVRLSHPLKKMLESAAKDLAKHLETYQGVSQVDSGISYGKSQFNFTIKPAGRALGITADELASQVRSAFYGAEALRQQRGRDEVKVMVRFPLKERRLQRSIEDLVLLTPSGGEIALTEAAKLDVGRSYTEIERLEGVRVLSVTGDVDEKVANAGEIVEDLRKGYLPILQARYPGLVYRIEGEQKELDESLSALKTGFLLALILIYSLLAIPFKSYVQPLIVMTSIPFGIIGAIFGHLLLGYELSIVSMFGIIALSGVVVNDSLVLVVTANRRLAEGLNPLDAVSSAALKRFRPIILTSLTTFFGLAPMIFETSVQARFLIPMAVSLGFGVLFSTLIVLFLVPSFFLILENFKSRFKK